GPVARLVQCRWRMPKRAPPLRDGTEQVQDHLMAVGRYADPLALFQQRVDDGGSGESLAGSGRALNRERGPIEPGYEVDQLGHGFLVRCDQLTPMMAPGSRRAAEEEIVHRARDHAARLP